MVTQVIEAADPAQAAEMGEYLISEGEVLSWGDKVLDDINIDVDEVKEFASLDYDQNDVNETLGIE